jgi:hypothetical protein
MLPSSLCRRGRPLCVAALLTAGLLAGPPLAPQAHAIIGRCAGDPIVVLSDGATIDVSATSNAEASAVCQIAYTLHVPAGTRVVSVTALGVRETLSVVADNAPGRYDTLTRVDASGPDGAMTTMTSGTPLVGVRDRIDDGPHQ